MSKLKQSRKRNKKQKQKQKQSQKQNQRGGLVGFQNPMKDPNDNFKDFIKLQKKYPHSNKYMIYDPFTYYFSPSILNVGRETANATTPMYYHRE
jgi:hypothetical protein